MNNYQELTDEIPATEVKEKAELHWQFLERWLRIMYVDAFIHGHKHGIQDAIRGQNEEVR